MTREEKYKEVFIACGKNSMSNESDFIAIIDSVFDEFENRTCANCNINEQGYCEVKDGDVWDTFGCNSFEMKTSEGV